MAQVNVRINGRLYQVACEDGQEAHLERLAHYIDQRVEELVRDVGQVGDARLLVMVSLLIADELADTYDELQELRAGQSEARRSAEAEDALAADLEAMAARVSALAERIERGQAADNR
jgi:cell division protein ZapA